MNRYRSLAAGLFCGIAGLGLIAGSASADNCTQPANINVGPFGFFFNQLTCNEPGKVGTAIGKFDALRKDDLCVNLIEGRHARATGYDGEFGQRVADCKKTDSTANGVEACANRRCAAATHIALEVAEVR